MQSLTPLEKRTQQALFTTTVGSAFKPTVANGHTFTARTMQKTAQVANQPRTSSLGPIGRGHMNLSNIVMAAPGNHEPLKETNGF